MLSHREFLIRFLPDRLLRDYMLFMAAVFIGILGTNNHIGVYITYVLVPILGCLYFEPELVIKTGIFFVSCDGGCRIYQFCGNL